jgi:hypothetical protein
MARPERPLDTDAGQLADFASDLRLLRQRAGSPSYRTLAARAHFAANTLSQAAAGQRLPSLEVTLAYVLACGGETEPWRKRWHKLRQGLNSSQPDPGPQTAEGATEVSDSALHGHMRAHGWLTRRRAALVSAIIVLAGTSAVTLASGAASSDRPQAGLATATAQAPVDTGALSDVHDGADPKQSGCATQATTLESTPITGANGIAYGLLELRYALACHAGWTRYTPAPTGPNPTTVTIVISRPSPLANASATFMVYDGAIYSDLELFNHGCLQASVAVIDNGRAVATGNTACALEP